MEPEPNPFTIEQPRARSSHSVQRWSGRREDFDYDVFISYRRRDGIRMAEWLSRRLRRCRAPKDFGRTVDPLRIYRDLERERATPAIWEERIRPALSRSRYLLLILTPSVLISEPDGTPNWVVREVSAFLQSPQGANLIIVNATGSDVPDLPADIKTRFREPGWIDIPPADLHFWNRLTSSGRSLRSKLAAVAIPAIDIADHEIPQFNQLAGRERRRSRNRLLGSATLALLIVASVGYRAYVQNVRSALRTQLIDAAGNQKTDYVTLVRLSREHKYRWSEIPVPLATEFVNAINAEVFAREPGNTSISTRPNCST